MAAGSRTLKLQILAEVSKLVDGLDQANKQVQTTGQKFQQGFAQVSKAVLAAGAAVGAFVGSSIKSYIEFDSKLTQSTAIMSNVTEEVRMEMENAARSVAKTLGISHSQAAESYYFLASAGLDAKQAIAALPQVAAFARAGMFDMALATDLATDAQSALGLTSKDAQTNLTNLTRVTDVLVKANTLANASVEQFSTALTTKAGTAMKMFGIDVESGVAVLAAMADQGIKAQVAGTNFAIVVRDLTTKAIANADAFEKLNIKVFDAEGNFRNMSDILADLEGALEGASDEQAKMTFKLLGFNDKSASAISSLIGLSGKIREYEEQLFAAGGTTQEVTDKQLDSMASQIAILQAKFEDFKIELAREFTPELTKLMDYITDTVIPFTEKYKDEIAATAKVILGLSAVIIGINIILKAYQAAMVVATVATAAFDAVMMMTPLGWVAAGIAAVVAGMIILESRTGLLRQIWEKLGEMLGWVLDKIKAVANFFGADFERAVNDNTAAAKKNYNQWDESRRLANQTTDGLRMKLIPAIKDETEDLDDLNDELDESIDKTDKLTGSNNRAADSFRNLNAAQKELAALRAGGAIPTAISPELKQFYKSELGLISQYGGKIEGINLLPTDPFYGFGKGGNVGLAIQQRQGGSATATGNTININVTGTVVDPEGTARAIQSVIQQSAGRAGNLILAPALGLE
jgi:TP901 family phage tail tape measure protein